MDSTSPATVRVAALGDLHFGKGSQGAFQALFEQIAEHADILLLCGDFTDYGLPEEARLLVQEINAALRIPVLAVLGNHDFHSGRQGEVAEVARAGGITVLDGDSHEVLGIGFAGVKGFGGGFGPRALGPWGEDIFKRFVHEAVEEALKLESALARLRTPHRIAVLHYAPTVATVKGEPLEIYPFLGSSRLEEPINRYQVSAVVHGHAHRGQPEGQTTAGVPVYNVSLPLMMRLSPERPFRILELPRAAEIEEEEAVP
ncbi:MAG TPA: metallophosphoesterase [Vicinamibacterales bacterium]|nr:metallophosphoesterase [Vicinamibacterales bacterium]